MPSPTSEAKSAKGIAMAANPILIDRRARLDPATLDCPVIHDLRELLELLGIHVNE